MSRRMLGAAQVDQVVHNTLLALREQPGLLPDWQTVLDELLRHLQTAHLDDESVFLAAVLTLLASPTDTLPTGTQYDNAWQELVDGLRTTAAASVRADTSTLDGLLKMVAEAALAVLTDAPAQRPVVAQQIDELRAAASASGMEPLAGWLGDVAALLSGTAADAREGAHEGVYHDYWHALLDHLNFFKD